MTQNSWNGKKNKNSGFTLVEMIVVLIILGILASAAVYGISAYINMTRYNSNMENAESIYQSAQSTLNHMSENGTLEAWTEKLLGEEGIRGTGAAGIGTPSEYELNNPDPSNIYNRGFFELFPYSMSDARPGESAHMRYAVTFIPGSADDQSKFIRELLDPDFRSTDIFSGVITIEFDAEKTLDTSGNLRLSASVYSVFYDSKRTAWSGNAYKDGNVTTVPTRDETYRRDTSLIGYVFGTNGTATVDSVYIPENTEIKDMICTLRNGETLDLTWSAVASSQPVTGKPDHIHYTFSLYDFDKMSEGNNKICDIVFNENSFIDGVPSRDLYDKGFYDLLKFDKTHFVEGATSNITFTGHLPGVNGSKIHNYNVVYTKEKIHDEKGIELIVYKASVQAVAKVYVHKATSSSYSFDYSSAAGVFDTNMDSNDYYYFPLTISYEIYDVKGGITISERLSYTLSLDSMMSRNIIETNENSNLKIYAKTLDYSFYRLISSGNKQYQLSNAGFPVNLYATMTIENDRFDDAHSDYNGTTLAASDTINAERALDDPVYLQADGSYRYQANLAVKGHGQGFAVVNSYFGDLGNGSVGTKPDIDSNDAVITSFRHLYNIRMLEKNTTKVCYSIVRDLHWFEKSTKLNEDYYQSDVIVYSPVSGESGLHGFSPVPTPSFIDEPGVKRGDKLSVVSFPSIPKLNNSSTLVAADNTLADSSLTDKTSVIYNLQMRMASFYDQNYDPNKLDGYGMINVNNGTVTNIRANAMTLVLNDTADGSPDDTEDIKDAIDTMLNSTVTCTESLGFKRSSPVGGLIGANNGIIGSNLPSTQEKDNTIAFSNCIVMSTVKIGGEWKLYELSACGGIIGDNNGKGGDREVSIYGYLRATGNFAAASWVNVGSVIGYTRSSVNAIVTVDNTVDTDKAVITFKNNVSSLLYASSDAIGGAIGSCENHVHFCQNESKLTPLSYETKDGVKVAKEPSDPVYAVNVNLDDHSYILLKSTDVPREERPYGIGGAVGRLKEYDGRILSVRVNNGGVITSSEDTNTAHVKNLGGAIGLMWKGTVTGRVDIVSVNNGKIGSTDGSLTYDASGNIISGITGYAHTTGGAVGKIDDFGSKDAVMSMIVFNNGCIFGNSSVYNSVSGVGGAIGVVVNSNAKLPNLYIYSENNNKIAGRLYQNVEATSDNKLGVGGAIGYIEYIPRNSSIYCLMGTNSIVYSNGNNAGGCIGSQIGLQSNAPNGNYTEITAKLTGSTYVRATRYNAGGCIGNAGAIDVYTSVRTIVNGTSSINALADVGGVCGRFKPNSATTNSSVKLETASSGSAVNIRAAASPSAEPADNNDNAGGLIGLMSDGNTAIALNLSLPSQTSGDLLTVNIDSYNNAGGMIGHYINANHSTSSAMNVRMHSESHIYARNNNAGGCIGYIEAKKDFNSPVTVTGVSTLTSAPIIKADTGNAGGLFGSSIGAMTVTSSLLMDINGGYIIGGNNAGGCIGNLSGNPTLSDTASVTLSGNTLSVSGTDQIGGIIGNCSGAKIHCPIEASLENLVVSSYSASVTAPVSNTGGCIGSLSGGEIGADGSITYSGKNSMISGQENVGGVIGQAASVTQNGAISGNITYSGEDGHIIGTGECTGGIAGRVNACIIKGNSVINYSGTNAKISGKDNTGGLFGKVNDGSSSETVKYLYDGDTAQITGKDNVGGIIGLTYKFTNDAGITFSPKTKCTITGEKNVGGIAGNGSDRGTANLRKYPVLSISGCIMEITGTEYVGGILGCSVSNCYYSGGTIRLTDNSSLIIKGSCAGGNLGYLNEGNLGNSTYFRTSCKNNSTITVIGSSVAGGVIGMVMENSTQNNTPHVSEFVVDSTSHYNVSATESGAYAGGIIGYNLNQFGRSDEDITLPSGGGMLTISADHAGVLFGYNSDKIVGASNHYYITNTTLNGVTPSVTDPLDAVDLVFGTNTYTSIDRFGFYLNGSGPYYSKP